MTTTPNEATKLESIEAQARRLGRIGAWAPGDYLCKCQCGVTFSGDKRAVQCLPCAVAALAAEKARPDLPVVTVPEGWALVPVEPTREMWAAGMKAQYAPSSSGDIWAAMIAAAPPPPTLAPVAPVALPGELVELSEKLDCLAQDARQFDTDNRYDVARRYGMSYAYSLCARLVRSLIQKGASDGE